MFMMQCYLLSRLAYRRIWTIKLFVTQKEREKRTKGQHMPALVELHPPLPKGMREKVSIARAKQIFHNSSRWAERERFFRLESETSINLRNEKFFMLKAFKFLLILNE